MMLLNTSLLRERFIIADNDKDQAPVVALGNRILLPLVSKNKEITERIVIRAHSMHMALRLAAEVTREFYNTGPIINRTLSFPWKDKWFDITSDFERPHTPETWCCVYNNGRPIYQDGKHHPFLDVIEQCDIKNREEYDRAILIAEDIFKQAGKNINIQHEVNIAVVIGALEDRIRCGLILRAPSHTTTFNLSIQEKNGPNKTHLEPHHGLELSACYLEAIQLAVTSGYTKSKLSNKRLLETSSQAKKAAASYKRIGRLNQTIEGFEELYDVRYRPEKPDFTELLEDAYRSHG